MGRRRLPAADLFFDPRVPALHNCRPMSKARTVGAIVPPAGEPTQEELRT